MSDRAPNSMLARLRATRLLRTGRPRIAFVLSRDRLLLVRVTEEKKDPPRFVTASRPLGPEAFREGPGGAPIAGEALAKALGSLLAAHGPKPPAASLVVPDAFVRCLVLDLPEMPEHEKELTEMIAWKAGRLFGDPPPPLRLAWERAGAGPTGIRLLVLAVPEDAAASWEAPFLEAGIRIGALEPAALAVSNLARLVVGRDGFFVWADGTATTTVFYREGALRLVRTRLGADPDEALQEIRFAASFVGQETGGDAAALELSEPCAAGPSGAPAVERFVAFREENGVRPPLALTLGRFHPEITADRAAADDPAVLAAAGAMGGMA